MKKKISLLLVVFAVAGAVYFLLYHKNKELKYIPENADMALLVDVKNVSRHYLHQFLLHPSEWFGEKKGKSEKIKLRDSGIKIPNFLQVFHLKNSEITDWYCVVELSDKDHFINFLKQEKFSNQGKNLFGKNNISVKIIGEKCLVKTGKISDVSAFEKFALQLLSGNPKPIFNASELSGNSHGSFVIFHPEKVSIFPVEIGENEITIHSENFKENFGVLISQLEKRNRFFELQLDEENIKKITPFFRNENWDSLSLSSLNITSKIEEVRDTIITYEYDNDFNEVEKISYQNILQPEYSILLKSSAPKKTMDYFHQKKWIGKKGEFTKIPFQPNTISRSGKEISIISKNNSAENFLPEKNNFLFLKNDNRLLNSFSTITPSEKEKLSRFLYLFYGNNGDECFVKIQFKKEELPLILGF